MVTSIYIAIVLLCVGFEVSFIMAERERKRIQNFTKESLSRLDKADPRLRAYVDGDMAGFARRRAEAIFKKGLIVTMLISGGMVLATVAVCALRDWP